MITFLLLFFIIKEVLWFKKGFCSEGQITEMGTLIFSHHSSLLEYRSRLAKVPVIECDKLLSPVLPVRPSLTWWKRGSMQRALHPHICRNQQASTERPGTHSRQAQPRKFTWYVCVLMERNGWLSATIKFSPTRAASKGKLKVKRVQLYGSRALFIFSMRLCFQFGWVRLCD